MTGNPQQQQYQQQQFPQNQYGTNVVQGIPVFNNDHPTAPPLANYSHDNPNTLTSSSTGVPPPPPPPAAAAAWPHHDPSPHAAAGIPTAQPIPPASSAVPPSAADPQPPPPLAAANVVNTNVYVNGPQLGYTSAAFQTVIVEDNSLPCGIGSGWVMFILGWFLCAIPWYVGACILFCGKIDPRERPGHIACTVMAGLITVLVIVTSATGANK